MVVPEGVGPGYDLPRGIVTLGGGAVGGRAYPDVREEVTIVSGLKLPWQTSGAIPDAGRSIEFHGNTAQSQIAGCKSGPGRGTTPSSPSCDQIVAAAVGGETRFPFLSYRAQPIQYNTGDASFGNGGRLSFRRGSDGSIERIDPVVSPRLAYEALFTGFAPADPADAARARLELTRRRTVLDLVRGRAERLVARVGRADRVRLEQHFDEIRRLETRLDALDGSAPAACSLPRHPGDDPPIGEVDTEGVETDTNKWSNEELRNEILLGLIHHAFACDLTRTAAHLFTRWKTYINMYPAIGVHKDLHGCTHDAGRPDALADAVAWHVRHFARLVHLLRETRDVDGTRLIDHTGQHLIARDRHPGEVVLSAMRAVGVPGPLGDLDRSIEELF
jgi:hypothetical protein